MRGHVRKRGAAWALVVDVGFEDARRCSECGRRVWVRKHRGDDCPKCGGVLGEPKRERRQVWESFPTRKQAESALNAALAKIGAGRDPFAVSTMTVDELARVWLEHKTVGAGKLIRPRTAQAYRGLLNSDVLPGLGHMLIVKVRPAHVQAVLDAMVKRGLAPATVRQARAVARGAFGFAVRQGLVELNPVTATEAPTLPTPDRATLSASDLMAIVAAAAGTQWDVPVLISCTLGARRSETLGLRWSSIDLDAGEALITHGVQRINRELGFFDVKTHRSRRAVPLPAITVARLRRWKKEQNERRLKLGAEWCDLDLVCENGNGSFLDPDSYSKFFKRTLLRLGLPTNARLHDARHGVATALAELSGGDAALIRDVLGHARSSFTIDVYVRPTQRSSDKARKALDEAFGTRHAATDDA